MLALFVNGTSMPFARVEHPSRCALVTRLVRIESAQTLVFVCPRPAPSMEWAPQGKPQSVQSFHDLGPAHWLGMRTPARKPAGEFGVNGEKLSCCHDEPSMRPRNFGRRRCHVRSRLRTSDINVVNRAFVQQR